MTSFQSPEFEKRSQAREMLRALMSTISNAQSGGQRTSYQPRGLGQQELPVVTEFETPLEAGGIDDYTIYQPDNRTGKLAWGGYANGKIPLDAMTTVADYHRLAPHAAVDFNNMFDAATSNGVQILLSDSYRDFDAQVSVRRRKGDKVSTATPGTSRHGWGLAIDVSGASAQKWMREHGQDYGWVWPSWAQKRGTKAYEPWHFEYVGKAPSPAVRQAPAVAAKPLGDLEVQ